MNEVEEIRNLARQIKRSDCQAFKALFEWYQQAIFNFLYYKLGNIQAAEDVLQEVFVKFWENRHQIKVHCSIKSYLFTIANNLALNLIRHHKIVLKYQMEQNNKQPEGESPYTAFEKKELQENLMKAVAHLPDHQRVVFMLSRFEELSHKEISERLNISVKTVESHIGKALKMLRKSILVNA